MRLDLNEVASHLRKRIEYDVNEPPLIDEESGIRCVASVVGNLVFQNTGTLILIRGSIQTSVELDCSRCLKPFVMDLDVPVEESFPVSGSTMWDDDSNLEDPELPEDAKEPLFEDNIFNLTELIRQSLAVSIPIRTVCSDDCKGICPKCGVDLNTDSCDCTLIESDSPFAVLSSLLSEKDTEKK